MDIIIRYLVCLSRLWTYRKNVIKYYTFLLCGHTGPTQGHRRAKSTANKAVKCYDFRGPFLVTSSRMLSRVTAETNVVLCCNYDYITCIIVGFFFSLYVLHDAHDLWISINSYPFMLTNNECKQVISTHCFQIALKYQYMRPRYSH